MRLPILAAPRRDTAWLCLLLLLSGVPALGYQLVWTRMFAVGLGREMPAALAVLAAFMAGLAPGAICLDRRIARSARPARWYAALELVIALGALLSALLIAPISQLVSRWLGPAPAQFEYWSLAFLIPFVIMLPATAAMGATLVAADRWLGLMTRQDARLGRIYAFNTLGAAVGVVLSTAVLMPGLGFKTTLAVLALVNLGVAVGMLVHERGFPVAIIRVATVSEQRPGATHATRATVVNPLFLSGLLGIGFEIVVIRIMAQIFEGTVYSYAAVLLVYLLGTALGGALYQRHLSRLPTDQLRAALAVAASCACILGLWVIQHGADGYRSLRSLLGDSMLAVTGAEILLATPVLLLPTIVMGALFCALAEGQRHACGGIGRALAINTAGGMLAPVVVALLLVPALGSQWSGLLLAWGYLLLLPYPWRLPRWLPAIPVLVALLLTRDISLVTLRDGERLLVYREGTLAAVAVTSRGSERNLRVNNRFQMGGTGDVALRIQRMQAHLPLLLHPHPREVLLMGIASGITAGAALTHPGVNIEAVELVPESLAMLEHFAGWNESISDSPRARLHIGDARRFVRTTSSRYDVVIGDLFHPARDGAALLYTLEHFQAVRDRLHANGLYCQWLPLYQMDAEMLRMTLRTFAAVFPHHEAWIASFDAFPALGLVGTKRPHALDVETLEARLRTSATLRAQLRGAAVRSPRQLAFHYIAGPAALEQFMGSGPLNLDDHPRILFRAPAFTSERGQSGRRTLGELLTAMHGDASPERLAARFGRADDRYRQGFAARDRYLDALLDGESKGLEAQVDGFIAAAGASVDFTLAYSHALSAALGAASSRPEQAREWLQRLAHVRPELEIAQRLLRQLRAQ
ncbi:MAG: fused MFS/spermidine synthase [Gammaproteobacteria bacterium]|nr:fused MFS/spermidine synthase [Gammaproteobacteria bacterium]